MNEANSSLRRPTGTLLAVLLVAILGALAISLSTARTAEAFCKPNPCINRPPYVTVNNPSVAVDEGQTATNSGTFGDPDDPVIVSASVGTITQDDNSGTWTWSYKTSDGPS